jgi:NAD(P)-dependent dehydrogenase (short-subunit alcohol dehydrogenase family)
MASSQSILITGASSGIGQALARACAAPGTVLHLAAREAERLQQIASACIARGAEVRIRLLDVRDAAALAEWIGAAGRLDLVVANAGISAGSGNADLETAAQVRAIFATNVDGVLNTVLPALEVMRAQSPGSSGRRGHIAVIASMAALLQHPAAPAYCASKTAVDRWTLAMAPGAARLGIIMISIFPGFVRTPMTARNPFPMPGLMNADQAARKILRGVAAGRRQVAFPWWMAAFTRLVGALPPAWVSGRLGVRGGKPPAFSLSEHN